MKPLRFRSVFVSDVHLGLRACKAEYLLDFLKSIDSDYLYLVGDIIDLWNLKGGWYWPPLHSQVVQAVFAKARNGTRVIYVPGNHDELFRDYAGSLFGGVHLMSEAIHETADGRKLLVLHGDEFDSVVKHHRWLAFVGSRAYDMLLVLNRWVDMWRKRFGFPYWSLAAYLKNQVKNAVKYISDFEHAVAHAAARRKVDGLVCGHIHKASVEEIGGALYCNSGDWVESCTALVEHFDGRLEIIYWADESVWLLREGEQEQYPEPRGVRPMVPAE
jgi:UDP-2,3-diacylglucosamine pyrophosphatase LpxH